MLWLETDLHVVQPVLTLVLHLLSRFMATGLLLIVGRWPRTFTLSARQRTNEETNCSEQQIRADESIDIV